MAFDDDEPRTRAQFKPGQVVRWTSDPDGLFWRVGQSSVIGGKGRTYEIRPIDERMVQNPLHHENPKVGHFKMTEYVSVFEFQLRELDKKEQAELVLLKVTDDP